MTGEKDAPAEMPGVEEIARATAIRITDAILDHVYVDGENVSASVLHPAAEIIADILAPILAEKERGLRKLAEDWDAYGVEQEMRMLDWRDRALAAEAALPAAHDAYQQAAVDTVALLHDAEAKLAGLRQNILDADIICDDDEKASDRLSRLAAAIRAQGE